MLNEVLSTLQTQLQLNNIEGIDAENTDEAFVRPILQAVGWDFANLGESRKGYSVKGLKKGVKVTRALLYQGAPLLLIEVKSLYSDITNYSSFNRVYATATNSQAQYLIITNGVDWHIYTIEELKEKDNKPSLIINVKEGKSTEFELLSKTNIKAGMLAQYIKEHADLNRIQNLDKDNIVKSRGYKVKDSTHKALNSFRSKEIMTNREVKGEDITNGMIVEELILIFLECAKNYSFENTANRVLLNRKIKDCYKKYFSK